MSPRTRRTGRQRSPRRGAARAENTVSTTMRLRRSVRAGLEQAAARAQRSVSEVAQELIDEGLRMRDCPGIYFATEPRRGHGALAASLPATVLDADHRGADLLQAVSRGDPATGEG